MWTSPCWYVSSPAPWVPLREGKESKQAADFISFYRAVSLYGKQSKYHQTMASTATPTLGSGASNSPCTSLCFDNVTFLFALPSHSHLNVFPSSYFIFGAYPSGTPLPKLSEI